MAVVQVEGDTTIKQRDAAMHVFHQIPPRRRGPIGWILDLPDMVAGLRARWIRRASADWRLFVFLRMLIPIVAFCVIQLAWLMFGPQRLLSWLVLTMAIGTACICLVTIRDLRILRRRGPKAGTGRNDIENTKGNDVFDL